MRVVLGNRHAIQSLDHGETFEPMTKGKRATTIEFPDEWNMSTAFNAVVHPQGVWASHAEQGATPAWVASDSPGLAALLSEHFGGIEVRELEDPDAEAKGGGSSRGARQSPITAMISLMLALPILGLLLASMLPLLKTNAGNDFVAKQLAGSASATAVAKWVAITANATAPAAADTTLTGEIVTAGGGLLRAVGAYAHTASAANYTLTTTFTANASDSLPVTIAKRGVFDAASAGNMVFETLLPSTATLSAIGDSLTITDTVSI